MVESPTFPQWNDFSIELCGGTHISNTREAEAFVILEETAVAKGIRRISGVTGKVALESIIVANKLEAEVVLLLDQIEKFKQNNLQDHGDELEALDDAIISFRKLLDSAVVSQVVKSTLRTSVELMQREMSSLKNKAMMVMVDKEITRVIAQVKSINAAGKSTAVLEISIGSDAKAIKRVTDEIQKVFFFVFIDILLLMIVNC
jgi:alanyl-tRNA synthetase